VRDAIVAVREAFFPHLDVEDAQIIPAIEVSVDPNEWDRIDTAALKSIPKQYLPMAVSSINEIARALPDAERPPPPPVPVRSCSRSRGAGSGPTGWIPCSSDDCARRALGVVRRAPAVRTPRG
jgi:hypothetical protein